MALCFKIEEGKVPYEIAIIVWEGRVLPRYRNPLTTVSGFARYALRFNSPRFPYVTKPQIWEHKCAHFAPSNGGSTKCSTGSTRGGSTKEASTCQRLWWRC